MDELIEAMATALDEALDNGATFVLHNGNTGHVELVDGDLPGGTPEIAKNTLNALHEQGWHFSRGTTCP